MVICYANFYLFIYRNGCILICILTLFSGRKFSGSVIVTVLCPNLPSQIQDKKTKIMLLVRVKS